MNGQWFWWYDNGNVEAASNYNMEVEIDSTKCYYESGTLARTLYQIDSEKDYWHVIDYHENGQKSVETFAFGYDRVLDSLWYEWDELGDLKSHGTLDSSYKVGTWRIINSDGEMIEVEEDRSTSITFNLPKIEKRSDNNE